MTNKYELNRFYSSLVTFLVVVKLVLGSLDKASLGRIMLLLRTLLLFLLTIFLDLKSIESRLADEFYCKVDENVFRVCRGCPTVDENCEDFTKCQCGKIELYSNS